MVHTYNRFVERRNGDNAMPFIPAPDIVQAELFYLWDGIPCENVLHFDFGATPTEPGMTALGVELIDWWKASFPTTMPTTLSLVNVKLTDLTTQISPAINVGTGLPAAGTSAGVSLPNNVALVLTKRTVLRGRSFRGRVYLPGLLESQVTGRAVQTSIVNSFINSWNQTISMTDGVDTWQQVVLSRFTNNNPRVEAISTPVIAFTSDGQVDTQRRRLT